MFAGGDAIAQVWLFVIGGSGIRFGQAAGAVPGYGAPDQYQQQWAPEGQEAAPAAHQWTPEQIAAWETQQAQAARQPQPGWPPAPGDHDGEAERTQIRPPR